VPAGVHRYDVVVVGYGAAGAMAAIEACDAGARVLLLEKMPQPGGISILSAGGIRISFDVEQGFHYLRETCGGRTPDDVLRVLAQGMRDVPQLLRRLAAVNHARISVQPAAGNYPFTGCDALGYAEVEAVPGFEPDPAGWLDARPWRPGCLLFKLLFDNVEHRRLQGRIDVWTSASAERLLQDAEGRVTGLQVRRGEHGMRVTADAGVVLACGGFEADEEMKRQYLPSVPVLAGSFAGNTGDGIRMAQAVGAGLWHMWHFHGPYGMRHPDPSYPFGIYVKALPMWTPGRPGKPLPRMPWIVVDRSGRRYVDEYPPYMSDTGVRQFDHFDPQAHSHSRLPSFMVFDEAGRRMYPMGRAITNDATHWYEWSEDNLAEVDAGFLRRASSIAELAAACGIDAAALEATIAGWNAACERGADAQFNRRPETMVPIAQPPFYLAELWPVVINTQGGPVHDARQRVLDAFGQPIDGLYAAGEMGSVFGHVYMAGGNLAECFVGGAIAGREAAARRTAGQREAA
jgi:succinate dehydrogenase/fumarate reductase flavoprotein subunit